MCLRASAGELCVASASPRICGEKSFAACRAALFPVWTFVNLFASRVSTVNKNSRERTPPCAPPNLCARTPGSRRPHNLRTTSSSQAFLSVLCLCGETKPWTTSPLNFAGIAVQTPFGVGIRPVPPTAASTSCAAYDNGWGRPPSGRAMATHPKVSARTLRSMGTRQRIDGPPTISSS